MSANAADVYKFPGLDASPSVVHMTCGVTFGVTSVASTDPDDPGITFTRTGVGTYTLAYPACPRARIGMQIQSAALTVVTSNITAKTTTSGTATVKTLNNAGAATDPATGDALDIWIDAFSRG